MCSETLFIRQHGSSTIGRQWSTIGPQRFPSRWPSAASSPLAASGSPLAASGQSLATSGPPLAVSGPPLVYQWSQEVRQ